MNYKQQNTARNLGTNIARMRVARLPDKARMPISLNMLGGLFASLAVAAYD